MVDVQVTKKTTLNQFFQIRQYSSILIMLKPIEQDGSAQKTLK